MPAIMMSRLHAPKTGVVWARLELGETISTQKARDFSAARRVLLPFYFLTISAFSSMAIPPRSAILPLTVIVFPANSANTSFIGL